MSPWTVSLLGSCSILLLSCPLIWHPFAWENVCAFGLLLLPFWRALGMLDMVSTSQLFHCFILYEYRAARPISLLDLLTSSDDHACFVH